jgi:catechol 2,3-dioxygenase-like lactoylglutathione lyase family enzyme
MGGIVFVRTTELEKIRRFYTETVGMELWLEQPGIAILKFDNLLIGFQQAGDADLSGLITFFYDTKEEVDGMYGKVKALATGEPKVNEKYNIYNFFAKDPEGRPIEFQQFLHPVEPI